MPYLLATSAWLSWLTHGITCLKTPWASRFAASCPHLLITGPWYVYTTTLMAWLDILAEVVGISRTIYVGNGEWEIERWWFMRCGVILDTSWPKQQMYQQGHLPLQTRRETINTRRSNSVCVSTPEGKGHPCFDAATSRRPSEAWARLQGSRTDPHGPVPVRHLVIFPVPLTPSIVGIDSFAFVGGFKTAMVMQLCCTGRLVAWDIRTRTPTRRGTGGTWCVCTTTWVSVHA
jgi:hypothetical protein